MKAKKITAALLTAALSAGLFSACSSGETAADAAETNTKENPTVNTYTPNYDNVKPLGRTYLNDDDTLWLAFSGSGAEFTFNGKKAVVTIAGDDNAEKANNEDNQARIAIYVNGERVIDDMVDKAEETYTVFESDTAADCDVKIVKLSETAMSTCAIKSIEVDSETGIKPAPAKTHSIEFIGDSITCGYGVDDEDRDHHFSTKTEDVTKAYAYKTAEALDADYSMVSISGYGIISGYSGDGKKVPVQTIPQYYTKVGFSYGTYGGKAPAAANWDFSRYQPEVVVINLGTNDDSYTLTDEEKQMEYCNAYVDLIKKVRENNPDAKIFCTLGIMGDRLFDYVQLAAYNYTQETGDDNIATMKFDVQLAEDGWAADWHPTDATHTKASEKLAAEIKEVMGW